MATRKIIQIDEALCDGCGECVTGCAEGALQIVDGKAKLVREDFCDGFGDCIGTCPTGALTIEERKVPDYDPQGGCPGSRMRVLPMAGGGVSPSSPNPPSAQGAPAFPTLAGSSPSGDPGTIMPSNLGQWPIQLHLIQPNALFFKNRELCVLSTCSPVAMPDAQWRFVRNRSVVMACPKLDRLDGYLDKLTGILAEPSIPRAVVGVDGGLQNQTTVYRADAEGPDPLTRSSPRDPVSL